MGLFGKAFGGLFGGQAAREAAEKAAKEAAQKAAKEAGEQAAKEAAEKGLSEAAQQSAREAAEKASLEASEKAATKTAGEAASEAGVGVVGGTAKAVAPIIKAIGPSAVLAGLGFYILNSLGKYAEEQIEELKRALREILCDTEDDDETCEQLVGSAIGLGGLFLAGGLVLGITFLTRKKATPIVIEDKRE